jgi:hypothetical protein
MANQASNHIKYLLATKAIDFANDAFKIILMAQGFVFDKDAHEEYADVIADELATLNGYTQGTKALGTTTVTENDTNDRCDISWASVSWTASGGPIGPACGAIIYDDTVSGDPIVGYIDFGANYTQADGGTATLGTPSLRIL